MPPTVFAIVQFTFLLVLVTLWIQERRSRRQEIAQLTAKLNCLESSLSLFMKECERILTETLGKQKLESTAASRASGPKPGQGSKGSVRLVHQNEPKTQASVTAPPHIKPLQVLRSAETTNQNRILGLATQGASAPEIASRLSVPQGEVELILNLSRITPTARKGKTA